MLRLRQWPTTRRFLALGLLFLSLASSSPAEDSHSGDIDPTGLWGGERSFGPEVRGPLLLEREGETWRLSIAGFEAEIRHPGEGTGASLVFELPGDRGRFRTQVPAKGERTGFWIQPAGTALSNAFATPVRLEAFGPGRWRGQVAPLDDRITLNLVITQSSDDGLEAFLRNPERNLGRYLRIGRVTQKGRRLAFFPPDGEEEMFTAELRDSEILTLFFPPVGVSFDLTRRDRDTSRGFHARTHSGARYDYSRPPGLDDGWATGDLQDAGLRAEPIVGLVREVLDTETLGVATPYLQGLLVARHGKLVLEEYFYGFHRDRPHDTRSAGKSLSTTLVGLALRDGAPFEVSTPVYTLLDGVEEGRDARHHVLAGRRGRGDAPGLDAPRVAAGTASAPRLAAPLTLRGARSARV